MNNRTFTSAERNKLPEALTTKIENYRQKHGYTKIGAIKVLLHIVFEYLETKGERYDDKID